MSSEATTGQLLQRARVLLTMNRTSDAESILRQALAQDPQNAEMLYLLAICVGHTETRKKEALEIAEQAIAAEPEWSEAWSLKSRLLTELRKFGEAHQAADHAVTLEPANASPVAAKSYVFARQQRWKDAEATARQALAIDADDGLAQNVLSQSVLWQGKRDDTRADVAARLSRDPEDAFAHHNAGYAALQEGDYRRAETHFLEALRLDASFEPARHGLLEAFRARSVLYRCYLKYAFALTKLSGRTRTFMFIGIYLAYRFLRGAVSAVSPLAGHLLVLCYLLFVTWSYVARGVANLMVLLDSRARHALRRKEAWEGIAVGGGIVLGALLVLSGITASVSSLVLAGIALIAPSIPLSLAFSNDHSLGVKLYGAIAGIVVACAMLVLASLVLPLPSALLGPAILCGTVLVSASTLMALFKVCYR